MSSKCIRDTVNKVKAKYQESDPYRLAAAMHIIVKKLPLGTDPNCCKGFCMRECRKTCIVINCDLPEIIQQIILIHEIGHALLHQKPLQIKCFHDFELFDGVSQCEYEANCFAADYLLVKNCRGVLSSSSISVPPAIKGISTGRSSNWELPIPGRIFG